VNELMASTLQVLGIVMQRPQAVHVGGLFADLRGALLYITSNPEKFHLRPQQPAKRASSSSSSSSSSASADDADFGCCCSRSCSRSPCAYRWLRGECAQAQPHHPRPSAANSCGGAEKKLRSMYAASGEFQVQVRLKLTDGTHFILAVVDTELLGLGVLSRV
jgi:hypothetical protein